MEEFKPAQASEVPVDLAQLQRRVEETANYEGNDSLLLFERLDDPVIRKQLVDHFVQAYQTHEAEGHMVTSWKTDEKGEYVLTETGEHVFDEQLYRAPTREEIESLINDWIAEEKEFTEVDYGDGPPAVSGLHLNWRNPRSDHETTEKEWSIIEAHEKGHGVRLYGKAEVRDYFQQLFAGVVDVSAVTYTKETFENERAIFNEGVTYEQAKQITLDYLRDPMEIAERMSQLKNYFGMSGSEEFTKQHLDHARLHYTTEAFDNGMTEFFQAITPETEARFLEVMNSAGI